MTITLASATSCTAATGRRSTDIRWGEEKAMAVTVYENLIEVMNVNNKVTVSVIL